ncbi:MAG: Orn/DAP/Arg decarboxylase 2 [Pseudonocardiales bacterium]|nr:Orn/DAP/Arg decarboxylase 2 [Pseudonocardiales bacterium]
MQPTAELLMPSTLAPVADTPFLMIDLDVVRARYRELRSALPRADVFYAVKANPATEILSTLIAAGSNFDVASPGEIELCLRLGADPSQLSYGNTIKKERDIATAHRLGLRTFAVDSPAELEKIIRQAPGATVYIRLLTDGAGADWPLSKKFGATIGRAWPLMERAARAGHPVGLSFHVGSQQRNPQAWQGPLDEVAALFAQLRQAGFQPAGVNVGGGLPSAYVDQTDDVGTYGAAIQAAIDAHLGAGFTGRVMVEPGRFLVGDAGVIHTEVVLISDKQAPAQRWVYLDVGLFNGLTEALGEAIRYRIHPVTGSTAALGPVVLAGPSCDSADVLYETYAYQLPVDLQIGDRLLIMAAGAYTASY